MVTQSVRYYAEQTLDLSERRRSAGTIGQLITVSYDLARAVLKTANPTDGDRADAEQVVSVLGAQRYELGELAEALELAIALARGCYAEAA